VEGDFAFDFGGDDDTLLIVDPVPMTAVLVTTPFFVIRLLLCTRLLLDR